MKHLLVMDPLDQLNLPLDSSLRLGAALARRGSQVFHACPEQLHVVTGHPPMVTAQRLVWEDSATQVAGADAHTLALDGFDSVQMRKDPPYDMAYVLTTLLLDRCATRVHNHPRALRDINEKLSILDYPDATAPAVVTSNPHIASAFAREVGGPTIAKPLDLFAGQGIRKLPGGATLGQFAELFADGAWRILQPFDESIYSGEVRAFTVDGQAIAWCLKRPAAGEFLANTRAGATLEAYSPPPAEVSMVESIARDLRKRGVFVCGFDIIGGHVSEINITSPRLLTTAAEAASIYDRWAALIEEGGQ